MRIIVGSVASAGLCTCTDKKEYRILLVALYSLPYGFLFLSKPMLNNCESVSGNTAIATGEQLPTSAIEIFSNCPMSRNKPPRICGELTSHRHFPGEPEIAKYNKKNTVRTNADRGHLSDKASASGQPQGKKTPGRLVGFVLPVT